MAEALPVVTSTPRLAAAAGEPGDRLHRTRQGSFLAAADVSGVSHGAISRRVATVERQHALESEAPALRIELGIELRNVDIAAGEADLSIRYGRGNWRQLETREFMPETLYPVALRVLATQLATLRRRNGAAALLEMPLLHDFDVTGWRTWFDALGMPFKPRAGSPFRGLQPGARGGRSGARRGVGADAASRMRISGAARSSA